MTTTSQPTIVRGLFTNGSSAALSNVEDVPEVWSRYLAPAGCGLDTFHRAGTLVTLSRTGEMVDNDGLRDLPRDTVVIELNTPESTIGTALIAPDSTGNLEFMDGHRVSRRTNCYLVIGALARSLA